MILTAALAIAGNHPVHRSQACKFLRMVNQLSRPGDGQRYPIEMILRSIALAFLCVLIGCSRDDRSTTDLAMNTPTNVLKICGESFAIEECTLWGYLGKRDGRWYCRWCIDADAETRIFVVTDYGDTYTNELQPSVSANSIPVEVDDWPQLDGQTVQTSGEHEDVDFYSGSDHRATYTIRTMASYEMCSNNRIEIRQLKDAQFHIRWTADAYIHGIECDGFSLDAVATLTGVSLHSEVSDASEVDDDAIRKIFDSVFSNGSFTQIPAKIRRIDEDDVHIIDFEAKFTPALTDDGG